MRYHFIFKFDSFVGLPMPKEPHKMQMTVCLSVASEKVLHKTVQKCGFLFHVGSLFFAKHISIALKWIDLQNFEQSQITKSCERIHCEYTHKLPRKTTVEVETFSTNCFVCVCEFQVFFWNMKIAFHVFATTKNIEKEIVPAQAHFGSYHNYI